MELSILPNAIEDDDGIVYIETDQCQQRGNYSQINFNLKDLKETESHQDGVENSDHRGSAIRPFEPKCNKQQHANQGCDSYGDSLDAQLLAGY